MDLNSIKPASKPVDPAQKPATDEPKKPESLSAAEAIKNADELYQKASQAFKKQESSDEDSDFEPAN